MATNSSLPFDPLRFMHEARPEKSREALIAEIAYLRAQSRGFQSGYELDDWLAAEAEVAKLKDSAS